MARIVLAPRAEADIVDIAAYTLGTWGDRQMVRYVDGLHRKLGTLAAQPGSGRRRAELGPAYRSVVYESHVIFYRLHGDEIVIVRVLHVRMTPERHLP